MEGSVTTRHRGFRRLLAVGLALLLGLAPFVSNVQGISAADLLIGGAAIITDANGDPVNLRDEASLSGDVLDRVPEDSILDVLGGPVTASDGTVWYRVAYDGQTGYMSALYLSEYTGDGNGGSGDLGVITSDVNLRSGPSTADDVLMVLMPGDQVTLDGGIQNGFYPVVASDGTYGWVYGAYVAVNGSASGTSARTNDALNLREGPSTSSGVITVIPAGSSVTRTGGSDGDWVTVDYNGMEGWVSGQYLTTGGEAAVTTDDVNFRTGPSLGSDVIRVVSSGRTVIVTGSVVDGFYPVDFDGASGWMSTDYVSIGGEPTLPSEPAPAPDPEPEPEPEPVPATWDIAWPMSDGEWKVTQGYNGFSSHYSSGLWAYQYSLDIVRTDGATAGQTVYSPVSGTVRWTEDSTGGISIDMGNGYAFAIFHITLDSSIQPGVELQQGQRIGFISGPGQNGNMGFDHIHLTLWQTDDGGNWSRTAVPFTGQNAINGVDLYDTGGGNQWAGTLIYP
jgi:uncharacterized protein YgiM (DUF1202 family)